MSAPESGTRCSFTIDLGGGSVQCDAYPGHPGPHTAMVPGRVVVVDTTTSDATIADAKLSKVVVAVSVAEAMANDIMQEMFRQGAYARIYLTSLLGAVIGCCDAAGIDVDGFLRHLRAQNGPADTFEPPGGFVTISAEMAAEAERIIDAKRGRP